MIMNNDENEIALPYLVQFADIVVDQTNSRADAKRIGHSLEHWYYALTQIRRINFTNTAARIDSPYNHLFEHEKRTSSVFGKPGYNALYTEINQHASSYRYNSDPCFADDIFLYRQYRSEHVLQRVAHSLNTEEMVYTFSRLQRGIFLVQKCQPTEPIRFPGLTDLDQTFDTNESLVDTFSFNTLFNDMMYQTQERTANKHLSENTLFVPFTYTLGVRYSNPYSNGCDIVVRGRIPLWCQTLFITECMRQLPFWPDTRRKGLLPFLKEMEFSFRRITRTKNGYPDPNPELTVIFERFAMDLIHPMFVWKDEDNMGNHWNDVKHIITEKIIYCDIPDEEAAYITSVADEWAKSQGLLLE